MATYANATTNPFIKPSNEGAKDKCNTSNNNQKEAANTVKNAPGMARLQSKRERKRAKRKQQENLLLDVAAGEDCATNAGIDLEHTENLAANNIEASSRAEDDGLGILSVRTDDNPQLIEDSCCNSKGGQATSGTESQVEQPVLESASELSDLMRDDQVVIDLTEISLDSPTRRVVNGSSEQTIDHAAKREQDDDFDDVTNSRREKQLNNETHLQLIGANKSALEDAEDEGGENNQGLGDDEDEDRAPMERDSRRHQHIELIKKLRLQLRDLERYAYERGELDQVPASIMAERQTVILDSLKRKLPLNIDKNHMEKLELEELKSQVDKEISELIDPLITKDHQLNQLKTQLTDLERYVSHLHKTLGKRYERAKSLNEADCSCKIHGCSTPSHLTASVTFQSLAEDDDEFEDQAASSSTIMNNETLPKTSRLIRGLMAQLICSDMKIQQAMKMEKDYSRFPGQAVQCHQQQRKLSQDSNSSQPGGATIKAPQFHDTAVWNMHIDRVLLATDSLTNLFNIEPAKTTTRSNSSPKVVERRGEPVQVDESLVDSIVRRQLIPAVRDLLAYGLIDPNTLPRPTYRSLLFDPYTLITALTCLPGSQSQPQEAASFTAQDKIHVWNVIEDYFNSHNQPEFQSSSVKTLSQSFNLTPSMEGPIKVTSKQGLLITLDDIIERLSRCKPNGPESHFKMFVYNALNQAKLATWIRIVFRSKSIMRKFYHTFSFVCQPDKMEKFLQVIDALNQIQFKLNVDTGTTDQFVSVF